MSSRGSVLVVALARRPDRVSAAAILWRRRPRVKSEIALTRKHVPAGGNRAFLDGLRRPRRRDRSVQLTHSTVQAILNLAPRRKVTMACKYKCMNGLLFIHVFI
jgi:hypothetical protein